MEHRHFACCWSSALLGAMTVAPSDTNVLLPGTVTWQYSLLTLRQGTHGDSAELICTILELHPNPGLCGEV